MPSEESIDAHMPLKVMDQDSTLPCATKQTQRKNVARAAACGEAGLRLALTGRRSKYREPVRCGCDRQRAGRVPAEPPGGHQPRRCRASHRVPARTPGLRRAELAALAGISVEYEALELSDDQRLIAYFPADETSSAALDRLTGRHPGTLRVVNS
jgi:hypothetical protein